VQTVSWEIGLDGVVPASVSDAFNNDIFQATREPDSKGPYNGLTVGEWWFLLNEYTIGFTFFDFLPGTLLPEPDGAWTLNGSIASSNLVNFTIDFSVQIEFFANVTLSMLGYSQNPIYVGSFGEKSFPAATLTQIDATITSYPQRYSYSRYLPWELYRAALGLAVLCLVVGGIALNKNGVDGDTSFSQVMVTTRNPELGQLCRDSTQGGLDIAKEVKKARVRFVMHDEYGQTLKGVFEIVN
jgi:hypothetical protein